MLTPLLLLFLPYCSCWCSPETATASCIAEQFSVSEEEVSSVLSSLSHTDHTQSWLQAVLNPRRSLLVIDLQNDFITGSLAIAGAQEIITPIQHLVDQHELWNITVFSKDWHPTNHISFFSNLNLRTLDPTWRDSHRGNISLFQEVIFARDPPYKQILWPDHCVQESPGSSFPPSLTVPSRALILNKGTDPDVDSYSAFYDNTGIPGSGSTGLCDMIADATEVVVVGLATDYCVGSTSLHSIQQGLPTTLLRDLSRPVNNETGIAMEQRVKDAGGWVESSNTWKDSLHSWERARKFADFWLNNGGKAASSDKLVNISITFLGLILFIAL